MEDPDTSCIIAGTSVAMDYCPNCGQKKSVTKRITILALFRDFINRIYRFDGMFPRTLRPLTIRPGEVARSYINGIRVKYVGPVGYYFLTLTFFLLVVPLLDIELKNTL